jgi:hypothetical protein
MATVNTIGTTGRDYSTLQAWEDAVPATPTGGYEGHCYNDSEFTAGVSIAGHTSMSATNYILLTAATGQSFQDHASVRANALFYDQTKGVGITAAGGSTTIEIDNDWVRVTRLQVKRTVGTYGANVIGVPTNNLQNVLVKDCIVVRTNSSADGVPLLVRTGKAVNCLVVNTGATAPTGGGIALFQNYANPGYAINCTVINTAAAAGSGIGVSGGNDNVINNCAVFGWSAVATGTAAGDYNGTNLASGAPGANSVHSLTASDQFENAANDFRLKAGSGLIGEGNTDATNAPNDISGVARGAGTAGDIGAWEAAGASTPIAAIAGFQRMMRSNH